MAAGDVIVLNENPFSRKGNYFDGVDDYVLHDAHAVARVAANDQVGTYTAWIYFNDLSGNYTILSAGDNDNVNEIFRIFLNGATGLKASLKHGGATKWQLLKAGGLTARRWTHIAVVQNGTQPILYIDGLNANASNDVSVDLTFWYDELTLTDKFAIGVTESNNTHTDDFKGAIGQVKYFNIALTAAQVLADKNGEDVETANLQFNITMEDDGITDAGLGADNGTLTGNAHYGGEISTWSQKVEDNVTGHAAEKVTTFERGANFISIIKRGD